MLSCISDVNTTDELALTQNNLHARCMGIQPDRKKELGKAGRTTADKLQAFECQAQAKQHETGQDQQETD
jgi:hypothetical protein